MSTSSLANYTEMGLQAGKYCTYIIITPQQKENLLMRNSTNRQNLTDIKPLFHCNDAWDCVEGDEERSAECIEHEKASHIKHIRQDLAQYRTYCPAEAMAEAIGGDFTGEFVKEVCKDSEWPVKHFERRGKCYLEMAPFLQKLTAGLNFEDQYDAK